MEPDEESEAMELVMPFVVCQTEGGDFDDDAYVHGFEAGRIDSHLQHVRPPLFEETVHDRNLKQLDLIAMSRGYVMNAEQTQDGWAFVSFVRLTDA